jgi:chloride channel protein, CIC family
VKDAQKTLLTNRKQMVERNQELGDFTATWRVFPISLLALVIGVVCAFVALALLRLIGLFTNLFYFGRWNTALISPVGNRLGLFSAFVPIAGALIIGAMAKYGSERIRVEYPKPLNLFC